MTCEGAFVRVESLAHLPRYCLDWKPKPEIRYRMEKEGCKLDPQNSGEGQIPKDTSLGVPLAEDQVASAAITVATAAVAAIKTVTGIQSRIFTRLATRRRFQRRDHDDLDALEQMVENAAAVRLRAVVESSIDSLRTMMCSCLFQSPAVLAGLIDELYIMERAFWVQPGRSEWWEKVVLPHWDDPLWRENFRMSRQTFMELCDMLRPVLERQTTNMRAPITVEKQLAIAVWKLATPDSYRSVAECFGVGRSTVSRIVIEVCQALYDVYHHVVHLTSPQGAMNGFAAKGFPHCIGAIDAMHIPIIAPAHRATEYINSKGYYSMVLQALVDHEGRFTDVYAGRSGKVHDARIFRSSPIFRAMNQGTFGPSTVLDMEGEQVKPVILGDLAYPLLPWLMTPYSGHLDTRKQLFNDTLGRCRAVVEYAFERLRGRWRCLLSRLDVRERYAPRVIVACCILHNICEAKGEPLQEGWEEVVRSVARSYQQPERQPVYVSNPRAREIRDLFSTYMERRAREKQS
ncbi:protein ANTAGONIST OF LIKE HETEROCHROMATIN PROTEIN 1-like isoform X1 [Varanus komodoensis]|uniref:protein ANTAGONIST OF LIKE HETEROCHROMATIN PROTEIN 1-like isoform X1 n=2 Tax=Varanus komodoensis TaxID=61221 RepID=UPI001CF77928|nr:protein ANTAGONIST OF LIKE HETEROCHROMATIN PROTEIN 1-like isoform X1 [Varanus komodoensis]